jgi:hypothetical protein
MGSRFTLSLAGGSAFSGPGRVPFATLSAAETVTLPEGECCDSTSDDVDILTFYATSSSDVEWTNLGSDQTNPKEKSDRPNAFRACLGPVILSVLTLAAVLATLDPADSRPSLPQGPGITLDESFNVQMGVYLVENLKNYGVGILDPESVEEVFGNPAYNPDHPPLGRLWLGVFHEISRAIAPIDSRHNNEYGDNPFVTIYARAGSAFAFAITVLLVGVFAGRRWGSLSGVTSSVSLAVMPRLFGHAHLASLETFMGLIWTVSILGTIHFWARRVELSSEDDPCSDSHVVSKWDLPGDNAAIFCGLLLGLALLTKMQAVLLPPLITVWAFWHWRLSAIRPLVVSGVSTTVVFVVGWPWLWLDLPGHLAEYFGRTTGRVSLNVWYLGQVFKDVDAPWHYPSVMTLVTVPVGILLLAAVGLWTARRRIFHDPTASLIVGSVIAPLVLFSLPGVAVYDGARLFLVAFPGIALLAGFGASGFKDWLKARKWPHKPILGVLLAGQLAGITTTTPYFLSYYNAVVGGTPGAERLGFEVSYWGDSFSREFFLKLVETAQKSPFVHVAPVLHQFQLPEIERQVPVLAKGPPIVGRVRLLAADKPLEPYTRFAAVGGGRISVPVRYLAVFHRRADAPSSSALVEAGWELVNSETCQGVPVASLWRRPSPAASR